MPAEPAWQCLTWQVRWEGGRGGLPRQDDCSRACGASGSGGIVCLSTDITLPSFPSCPMQAWPQYTSATSPAALLKKSSMRLLDEPQQTGWGPTASKQARQTSCSTAGWKMTKKRRLPPW